MLLILSSSSSLDYDHGLANAVNLTNQAHTQIYLIKSFYREQTQET